MQKFTIPFVPEGYNQLAKTKSWQSGMRAKEEAKNRVVPYIRAAALKPVQSYPCTIVIAIHQGNRRRDVDNVKSGASKVLLDTLKWPGGVIVDDSQKYVRDVFYAPIQTDRKNPQVEIYIYEKGEEEECLALLQSQLSMLVR